MTQPINRRLVTEAKLATGLAAKQDVASLAADVAPHVADGSALDVALKAALVTKWRPNTAYASGEPVVNPSGQLVTANAAFTSGASYVAGNWAIAAFAPRDVSSVVLLGDSISDKNQFAQAGAYIAYQDEGYWTWASIILGQRMSLAGVFGYSGQRTDVILTHVADAIATGAGWLIEEGGTNDVTGGVSAATIQTNKLAMWRAALNAGMRVVATTIIPQASWTAAQKLVAQTVNQWIRSQSSAMRGIVACSWDVPLIDPATGNSVAGILRAADGIHPSPTAAALMGARLAAVLEPLVPKLDICGAGGDPTNILTNSAMTGNSAGLSTGYNARNLAAAVATTGTLSKVARTDDVPGEWQQIVMAPGDATGLNFYRSGLTGYAIGDTVSGFVEFQRGTDWANIPTSGANQFRLRVQCLGSNMFGYGLNHVGPEVFTISALPLAGVIKTPPFVIPAGTTGLIWGVEFAGQGTLRIGRGGVRLNQG